MRSAERSCLDAPGGRTRIKGHIVARYKAVDVSVESVIPVGATLLRFSRSPNIRAREPDLMGNLRCLSAGPMWRPNDGARLRSDLVLGTLHSRRPSPWPRAQRGARS